MEFRIADTFTDSLARLTAQEQKAAKTTAFDLQMNPASPGLSFHKLDRAKDSNFWSVRVNADIRIIVHRTAGSILLVYVDHHDDAYKWAERRKIERHPTTGAMQLVEVRERIEEVEIYQAPAATPAPEPVAPPGRPLFDNLRKFELMAFGVPEEWVDDVRRCLSTELPLGNGSCCALFLAGHGGAAASFVGERVGAPMASAPGVEPFGVEPDGADGLPVSRPA